VATPFHLTIATAERQVVDQDVVFLTTTTVMGQLGILAHHISLIAQLRDSSVAYRDQDGTEYSLDITGGILDVGDNRACILADQVID